MLTMAIAISRQKYKESNRYRSINQVEHKLKSDVTRIFLSIFVAVEIHWPNTMVDGDDDRPEVSLLFLVGCSTCLT
jgi:hypothetical protein